MRDDTKNGCVADYMESEYSDNVQQVYIIFYGVRTPLFCFVFPISNMNWIKREFVLCLVINYAYLCA